MCKLYWVRTARRASKSSTSAFEWAFGRCGRRRHSRVLVFSSLAIFFWNIFGVRFILTSLPFNFWRYREKPRYLQTTKTIWTSPDTVFYLSTASPRLAVNGPCKVWNEKRVFRWQFVYEFERRRMKLASTQVCLRHPWGADRVWDSFQAEHRQDEQTHRQV